LIFCKKYQLKILLGMSISSNTKQKLNGMIAALVFACLGIVAITWASLQPDPKDEFVGLVYPFSYSQQDVLHAISQTDLKLIRFGRTDNIVIVAVH
jgi:hypothetical protein